MHAAHAKDTVFWERNSTTHLKIVTALIKAGVPYSIKQLANKRNGVPYFCEIGEIFTSARYHITNENQLVKKRLIAAIFEHLDNHPKPNVEYSNVREPNHSDKLIKVLSKSCVHEGAWDNWLSLLEPKKPLDVIRLFNIPLQNPDVLLMLLANGDVEGAKEVIAAIGGVPKSLLLIEPTNYVAYDNHKLKNIHAILTNPEILEFLVSQGLDLTQTAQSEQGETYNIWDVLCSGLSEQSKAQWLSAVKNLATQFQVPLKTNGVGGDPLTVALRCLYSWMHRSHILLPEIISLLEFYKSEDISPETLDTIAYLPADTCEVLLIQKLIEKNVDLTQPINKQGQTLLHGLASKSGKSDLVLMLLKSGRVNMNAVDFEGNTPLMCAIQGNPTRREVASGDFISARVLIHMGADPSVRNKNLVSVSDMLGKRCAQARIYDGVPLHYGGLDRTQEFRNLAASIVRNGGSPVGLPAISRFSAIGYGIDAMLYRHRNSPLGRFARNLNWFHPQRYTRELIAGTENPTGEEVGVISPTKDADDAATPSSTPLLPTSLSDAMQKSLAETAILDAEISKLANAFSGEPRQRPLVEINTGAGYSAPLKKVEKLLETADSLELQRRGGALLEGIIGQSCDKVISSSERMLRSEFPVGRPTLIHKNLEEFPSGTCGGELNPKPLLLQRSNPENRNPRSIDLSFE